MSHIPQAQETDAVHTGGRVMVDSRGEAAKAIHILGGRVSAVRSIADVLSTAGGDVQHQSLDGGRSCLA